MPEVENRPIHKLLLFYDQPKQVCEVLLSLHPKGELLTNKTFRTNQK